MTTFTHCKIGAAARTRRTPAGQRGMFLLEALIAILIFSFGILGLVGMQSKAISAQSDTQYRIEAANFANRILSQIWVNIDRSNMLATPTSLQTSLLAFQHKPGGANCNFTGAASTKQDVLDWVTSMTAPTAGSPPLPGASTAMQQILVNTAAGNYNQVTVTVCWQSPIDLTPRRHTVITYINS
jgi:type IV pilus assembly protein PilV